MESKPKVKTEELEKIREFRQKYQSVALELGNIELQSIALKERRNAAEAFLAGVKEEESKFAESLKKDYGSIDIDLETGEFSKLEEK